MAAADIRVEHARGARYVFRLLRQSGQKVDEIVTRRHHQTRDAWEGQFSCQTNRKEMKQFGLVKPKTQELFSVAQYDGCIQYSKLDDLLLQSHRTGVSDWQVLAKIWPKHVVWNSSTGRAELAKPLYIIKYKNVRWLKEPLALKYKKGTVSTRRLDENEQAQVRALI